MASKKRIGTIQDAGQMKAILKIHVQVDPTTCQQLWQYKGLEEVAENYVGFLTAVAKTDKLLSKKILSRALRAMHEGDKAGLDAFAQCMVDTLSGCRAKLPMLRSGAKTCDAVVKVCEAWTTTAGSSSSLEVQDLDEAVSSEAESGDAFVVGVGDQPDEVDEAKEALLKTMALFGGEAPTLMRRTLAKKDSILSIGSSAPTSPKTASVDAMLDIKADHPLLTPGAFMYRGNVVLESWLMGSALIRAVQEMHAPVNSHWFYMGASPSES
jgi:hypothetical protein